MRLKLGFLRYQQYTSHQPAGTRQYKKLVCSVWTTFLTFYFESGGGGLLPVGLTAVPTGVLHADLHDGQGEHALLSLVKVVLLALEDLQLVLEPADGGSRLGVLTGHLHRVVLLLAFCVRQRLHPRFLRLIGGAGTERMLYFLVQGEK